MVIRPMAVPSVVVNQSAPSGPNARDAAAGLPAGRGYTFIRPEGAIEMIAGFGAVLIQRLPSGPAIIAAPAVMASPGTTYVWTVPDMLTAATRLASSWQCTPADP